MEKQVSAEYIKTKIIDHLINQNNNIILGNEVMYGTRRKLVDLLMLDQSYITGIEIKSTTDNLNRLEGQVQEYQKIFNNVIVCTTEKHYHQVCRIVPKSVGLFLFTEDTIILKRSPTLKKILDKVEILYSIPVSFLKKTLEVKNNTLNSDEIRETLLNLSNTRLQSLLYSYFTFKLSENYNIFRKTKGIQSHIDDIPLLSLKSTKVNIDNIF